MSKYPDLKSYLQVNYKDLMPVSVKQVATFFDSFLR